MQSLNKDDLKPADRLAAHAFLTELRTRIVTQPLPYQYGVEERALSSLVELFAEARSTIKKHPGCRTFAQVTINMLNVVLRPITAKWHRALKDGLMKSRDGCNSFRADLDEVRKLLQEYAVELHLMAYDQPLLDQSTPEVMSPEEVSVCFKPMRYGIEADNLITKDVADKINAAEGQAIAARRQMLKIDDTAHDAVGLGLSGGGIRSATFCLGVVQVLASRGLLKDVDYLSTVSGGGYTGSLLSSRLSSTSHSQFANPEGPDSEAIRYVRQHAKYIDGQ